MLRLALVSLVAAVAFAQKDGPIPAPNANPTDTSQIRLNGKRFPFNALPFQADTSAPTTVPVYRGPQTGYNNCTGRPSTQDASCQTLIVNSIDDFCFFSSPTLMNISDSEGITVAYCTKNTHGARVIPEGTLTAVQFITAPSYVEVTGLINQQNVDIPDGQYGGELDSGGQDQRGNPMGGLAYSLSLPKTPGVMTQSVMWHLFIGGGMFCMKLCDNGAPNASGICRHTLDTIGCAYNVPAAYAPDVFLSCDSDDQAPVATDVTAIPASSNCKTYASTDLYPANGVSVSSPATSASGSATVSASRSSPTSAGHSATVPSGSTGSASPSTTAGGSAATLATSTFGAALAGLLAFAVLA